MGIRTLIKEKDNQLQRLLQSIQVKTAPLTEKDDFNMFISDTPISIDCTPLEWWCRPMQRQRYPRLHRMAIDILSIPPGSPEPERTFSGARRTASWDRLRLTIRNIEKVECIGNWLREGHIIRSSRGGAGLICDPGLPDDDMDMDQDVDG